MKKLLIISILLLVGGYGFGQEKDSLFFNQLKLNDTLSFFVKNCGDVAFPSCEDFYQLYKSGETYRLRRRMIGKDEVIQLKPKQVRYLVKFEKNACGENNNSFGYVTVWHYKDELRRSVNLSSLKKINSFYDKKNKN